MPLPIAHSMMGYAISEVAEAANVRLTNKKWLNVSIFVTLANLPDSDFLPGFLLGEPNRYHQWFTHSLGFAALAGLCGGLIYWRQKNENSDRFGLHGIFIGLAVLSHLVLDLLTWDSSPPKGMMLFWPFDKNHYDVRWDLFLACQRDNTSATFFSSLFSPYNLKVVLREFLIMAPIVGLTKIFERLWSRRNQSRTVDIKNTQVAKLGLLEVSPLPVELANRRSLTALAEVAEQDEHEQ
jgi:inner membrane protein